MTSLIHRIFGHSDAGLRFLRWCCVGMLGICCYIVILGFGYYGVGSATVKSLPFGVRIPCEGASAVLFAKAITKLCTHWKL